MLHVRFNIAHKSENVWTLLHELYKNCISEIQIGSASIQFEIKRKVIKYAKMIIRKLDWSLTGDQDKGSFISRGLYFLCLKSKLEGSISIDQRPT